MPSIKVSVQTNQQKNFITVTLFFVFADRDYFIIYYLTKGLIEKFASFEMEPLIHQNCSVNFSMLVEPQNFSTNLVNWTQEKYELKDEQVVEIVVHKKVCLTSGKCVVPGDVGSNCCLF